MTLTEGDKAPAFSALDHDGVIRSSDDFAGQWLLLYFYPKDDTPGCTTEACGLRDVYADLSQKLTIVGVSADSSESHALFREKYHLPFTLLADPKKIIITDYGTDGVLFPKRTSFLIDPHGVIQRIYRSVKPEEHATEILRDIGEIH